MNTRTATTTGILAAIFAVGVLSAARVEAQADKAKAPTTLTTFWSFPGPANSMTLVVAGQPQPVTVAINSDLSFGGVCAHCTLNQPFKANETKMMCKPCGCGKTNAVCIAWKDLKQSTWEEMIGSFPVGIAMKATFNTQGDPASGLKSLWVDRRTLLVPVDGMVGKTPAEVNVFVKAIGGVKGELVDGDKRLVINLKSEWDADQAPKLEKALAKMGAKIVRPEAVAQK